MKRKRKRHRNIGRKLMAAVARKQRDVVFDGTVAVAVAVAGGNSFSVHPFVVLLGLMVMAGLTCVISMPFCGGD